MRDPALLELFRSELETHLATLSEGLLELEKSPGDFGPLEALLRAAHSIKGAAKIVGVEAAVRLSHALEDCFVAARDGKLALTSDAVDVLLRGVDCLSRLGANAVEASPGEIPSEDDLRALLEGIAAVRAGRKGTVESKAEAAPQASPSSPQFDDESLRPSDLAGPEVKALRGQLFRLLERGDRLVKLDLSSVREVDPAGLALLVLAVRSAHRRIPPARLQLVGAAPGVRRLLRWVRLEEAFAVFGEGG
jgi:two-component system sensor histidine kinase and response regulator WspE